MKSAILHDVTLQHGQPTDVRNTYRETSSSSLTGTHGRFPKRVSRWDESLNNHPCRRPSVQKRKKQNKTKNMYLNRIRTLQSTLDTTCIRGRNHQGAGDPSRCSGAAHRKGSGPQHSSRAYLFQFFPVVVAVSHHHGPQFRRLEELQDFAPTHL